MHWSQLCAARVDRRYIGRFFVSRWLSNKISKWILKRITFCSRHARNLWRNFDRNGKSVLCIGINSKLVWWNNVSKWLLNNPLFITTTIILLLMMEAKISTFEYARTSLWRNSRYNFCGVTRTLIMTEFMTEWNLNVTLCGPLNVYCLAFCDKCLLKWCSIWYWSNPIIENLDPSAAIEARRLGFLQLKFTDKWRMLRT